MNKKEFLDLIKYYLKSREINAEEIEEIIHDFEEHFEMGKSEGRTESDICDSLGNPKDIAHNYEPNRRPESLYHDKYEMLNNEFNISGINTVTYELNMGKVELYPSEDDKIHVKLLVNDKNYIEEAYAKTTGEILNIKVEVKSKTIIFMQKCVLRILIPDSLNISVIGKLETGSVDIGDLNTLHLSTVVKMGDIKAINIISRSFIADISTGSLKIRNIKSNIRVTVKTGDIVGENLSGKDVLDLNILTGSIKLEGIYSNIKAEIKTGDFKLTDNAFSYDADIQVKIGTIRLILGENGKGNIRAVAKLGSAKIKRDAQITTHDKVFASETIEAVVNNGVNKINLLTKIGDILIK